VIRTSRQLKALVRNMSMGDSAKSQVIIRNYVMERFLERLSLSQYRNNMILKGGILVAAFLYNKAITTKVLFCADFYCRMNLQIRPTPSAGRLFLSAETLLKGKAVTLRCHILNLLSLYLKNIFKYLRRS